MGQIVFDTVFTVMNVGIIIAVAVLIVRIGKYLRKMSEIKK